MKCSEICPIAVPDGLRKKEPGRFPNIIIRIKVPDSIAHGVEVTALDNNEYQGVATALVPEDATPSCNLPQRITEAKAERRGSIGAAHERCPYIPKPGGETWMTVLKA